MTEQQRKAIEILNGIRDERNENGLKIINDDDYFFLLSFIIDKPREITIPSPYPVIQPLTLPMQPLTPYYSQ
jgi:hypothetical protein